jgi:hypothetical protein
MPSYLNCQGIGSEYGHLRGPLAKWERGMTSVRHSNPHSCFLPGSILHLLEPLDPDREVLGLCLIYNLTSTLKPTAGVARLYLKIHASPPQGPPSASDSIHPARGPLGAWCSVLYFMPSLTPAFARLDFLLVFAASLSLHSFHSLVSHCTHCWLR